MKKNVVIFYLSGFGLLFSHCLPSKQVITNENDVVVYDKMQSQAPEEPIMVQEAQMSFSGSLSTDVPKKGGIPIERVKLKGSPRGILTWRADYAFDTASLEQGTGHFEAKKEGNTLNVNFVHNGVASNLFSSQIGPGSIAQLGLFETTFNGMNHAVVFFADDNDQMKTVVVKMPNAAIVPFALPASNTVSPLPVLELSPNKIIHYQSSNEQIATKTYTCVGNQMVQN
jgi:hypothetical protein